MLVYVPVKRTSCCSVSPVLTYSLLVAGSTFSKCSSNCADSKLSVLFLVSNPFTFMVLWSVKAIAHCSAVVYDGEYGSHIDVL